VFAVPGREDFIDGDEVASTKGWYDFGTWVEGLPPGYDALAELIEEGGLTSAGGIAALEKELARALKEGRPPAHVLSVGERLLEELRDRPEGADEMALTDGSEPPDPDDEED
jgi:hypothetical protein